MKFTILLPIFLLTLLIVVSAQTKYTLPTAPAIKQLKFIAEYDVPHKMQFKGTTIGGLSGIDYDPTHQIYYCISDDRSDRNPARFYTLKINTSTKGIDTIIFQDVKYLLQPDGTVYPNVKRNPYRTPDPESMRYNPTTNHLIWTSEGERELGVFKDILENPAITTITTEGKYIDTFPLPPQTIMHKEEVGPRKNGVFEGCAFANDYKDLYVSIEEPLYQDAPRADTDDVNPMVRILKYDVATKKNTAQYAYKLDPVAHAPLPLAFRINGIPDILWVGKDKLLVMERSFGMGRMACTIKIFEADLSKATNIINNMGLLTNKNYTPITKKLLLNLDSLGRFIDNVEGMTFGPTLPNGHKTLVTVVDDNFSFLQKTQFFLFEVVE